MNNNFVETDKNVNKTVIISNFGKIVQNKQLFSCVFNFLGPNYLILQMQFHEKERVNDFKN